MKRGKKKQAVSQTDDKSSQEESSEIRLVQLLAQSQAAMFAYAAKLLGDSNEAHNVVQEANLIIWKKAKEFEPGTDFMAWASRIVYYQVLANIRDRKRQRLVFSEELIAKLAQFETSFDIDDRRVAMRSCIEELRPDQKDLIRRRYFEGESVKAMSDHIGKSHGALRKSLMRIRRTLMQCIELRLGELS